MDKQIELKRLIADYNTVVIRLNNAEKYFDKCTDKQYDSSLDLFKDLIKQASEIANRIENFIGRPLTTYEILHGINI
ncbi:hypothetical protein [Clostridium butyricum]|uniref:hypothetical protein n=1 Tax=Clostridium butyricum TaxID=1492 RepID=UPI0013D03391|nr:hypothetical protein [Clostridium butyricum]MCQ2016776.1 hypothetical protein [Clostridium butyricum]MCQ2020666.1 hypothetical protein [Clostridium butyricum]NFB69570.1 hypothetical protein [Clostridium butyricum]NFB90375.1 hypothetical protein [Clostridium butyricum]UTY54157.1 hypothetical protein HNS01_14015 [Clostridium butyricum]